MKEVTDLELAWVAGIIDGEGCIIISKQNPGSAGRVNASYRCSVKVAMNHEETIRKLAEFFGGSVHELKQRAVGRVWNTTWQWWISSRLAEPLLVAIRPYVVTKREEVELALEFLALPRFSGGNGRGATPIHMIEERERYFIQMRDLKPRSLVTRLNKEAAK